MIGINFFVRFLESLPTFYNSLVELMLYSKTFSLGFISVTVSMWQILLGGGLVGLVVASIIKAVTPGL